MKKLPYVMTTPAERRDEQSRADKRMFLRQARREARKKQEDVAFATAELAAAAKAVVAEWERKGLAAAVRRLDLAVSDYEEAIE